MRKGACTFQKNRSIGGRVGTCASRAVPTIRFGINTGAPGSGKCVRHSMTGRHEGRSADWKIFAFGGFILRDAAKTPLLLR